MSKQKSAFQKSAFIEKIFYPKLEKLASLTYRERVKLNSLITGDLICSGLFFLFGALLFAIKSYRFVGVLMITSMAFFVASIVFIKIGRIYTGSYLSTIGYLVATFIINFFVGFSDTGFIFFRGACFCVVMANFNYILSIKKAQTMVFFIGSLFIFVLSAATVYRSIIIKDIAGQIATVGSCTLGILGANLILISAEKQTDRIIKHSEDEHNKAEFSLKKITNVLSQTKESMNIGQILNSSANSASKSANTITNLYNELIESSDQLKNQTETVKDYSEQVNYQAGLMAEEVQKQNEELANTSSTVTEISSHILTINTIADKRRDAMQKALEALDEQGKQVVSLVSEVEKVKESSAEIVKFVKTIDDIADQTSLLAMNASIEASHAGVLGKGFSVIAQQIRKLSEETSANASKIASTLKENTNVVQAASDSVSEFANSTDDSISEIRGTVNSMEEIIHGIDEISKSTMEISNSIQGIVQSSSNTEEMISNVAGQISEQDDSLVEISNATDNLTEKVNAIKTELVQINGAIDIIHSKAKDNEEVSGRIASLLD